MRVREVCEVCVRLHACVRCVHKCDVCAHVCTHVCEVCVCSVRV